MPGKSFQLNLRQQAHSGQPQSSLFVQQTTHSKPWALNQGRGAFVNKQGGVSFADEANDQYN